MSVGESIRKEMEVDGRKERMRECGESVGCLNAEENERCMSIPYINKA